MLIKRIGLSLRVETIKVHEEKRDSLSHDWIDFFEKLFFSNSFKRFLSVGS